MIGNTVSQIKNYIQQAFNAGNLAFVLLVGDAEHIVPPLEIEGAADPAYALLAGDDTYPDIMVGRFSAQSPEELATQVEIEITGGTAASKLGFTVNALANGIDVLIAQVIWGSKAAGIEPYGDIYIAVQDTQEFWHLVGLSR